MDEYVSEDGTFLLRVRDEEATAYEKDRSIAGWWLTIGEYVRVPNPNDPDE